MAIERAGSGASDPSADLASEASLLQAVIGGSEEALASLYDRHVNTVFAAAQRVTSDRTIAADVVQETFLALWDRAELFDPTRGVLAAWLATIARHRAIDRWRAASRPDRALTFSSLAADEADDHSLVDRLTATGELIGVGGPEPLPEVVLTDNETRAAIVAALASLAPPERRVIVLAYDGGLTQSEIAATLGWPIGTVKTRTRRGLRHLRDRLAGSGVGVRAQRPGARTGHQHTGTLSAHSGAATGGRRQGHMVTARVDSGCSGAAIPSCA
jgi:RNA polymerase sigma-70 factor (ECF subfamily)